MGIFLFHFYHAPKNMAKHPALIAGKSGSRFALDFAVFLHQDSCQS